MLTDVTNRSGESTSRPTGKAKLPPFTVSCGNSAGTFDENGLYTFTAAPPTAAQARAELAAMRSRITVLVEGALTWGASSQKDGQDPTMRREAELFLAHAAETEALIQQAEQLSVFNPPAPVQLPISCDYSIFAAPQPMQKCADDDGAPSRRPMVSASTASSQQRSSTGTNSSHGDGQQTSRSRSATSWPPTEPCVVLVVEFKRQRVARFRAPTTLEPGTYVLVLGDRGFDCGLVVQCGIWDCALNDVDPNTLQSMDPTPVDLHAIRGEFVDIIREASPEEVAQLHGEQASKERLALKTCRDLVRTHKLDMDVIDCEYQFDGSKISFFFQATHPIDFRPLNKDLFRIFNARIWLENINTAVRNVVPTGGQSRAGKPSGRHHKETAQWRRSNNA